MISVWEVLTYLLGSGFLLAIIKLILERRKRNNENAQTAAQTDAIHISNNAHRLEAIGASNKTIKDLLKDAEDNVTKMRTMSAQLGYATQENEQLTTALSNAKAIIGYQKDERHEWTQQLKQVLEELAEARVQIELLTARVAQLEPKRKRTPQVELGTPEAPLHVTVDE
jgi:chromosome segregation ATPase